MENLKKFVILNHLISQNGKTLLLLTRNLRKSNFAKWSLIPRTTHPHLSWFTWWHTAGASCCLLIFYFVAKYQMSSDPHGPVFYLLPKFVQLTLWPLRTSILVPPAAYVSCWGVEGAATHLSAVTQSYLLCRVASRESCPTFTPFRHDKNIEWYGYCSLVF